jgi:cell division protein FtsI (penicillin-binding protein 3)
MKNRINWLKFRIFLIFFLFFLSFILILLRVLQLQILEKENLQGLAERQHQRIIELVPRRGTILDRNQMVLAESSEIESLYAHPRQIKDVRKAANKIAPILGVRKATIEKKLRSQQPFVWLQRKILPTKAKKIRNLGIKGINFLKESQRYYPNGRLAANLLGFVGVDPHGLEGLEFQYDRYLNGHPHKVVFGLDAKGGEMITDLPIGSTDLPRHSIVLTIDLTLQDIVEQALTEAVSETKAKSAQAVVMEPETGKILAMASRPSFNPNILQNYNPDSIRNRVITDVFEPGSIFKVFLLAVALEEKATKKNEIFFCYNGKYQIGKEIIHDHKKFGWLTLPKIIKFSSNIGASQIGLRIGAKTLDRYIRSFGFGARTGIRLPGEVKGIVRNPNTLSEVGVANTAFGQGLSVTAIQLIAALSALANGGELMRPYVVDRIIDQNGRIVTSFRPESRRRIISEETSLKLRKIIKQVVEPGGTGTRAALPGYEVAGKTGTAQKIDPLLKKYSDERYIGSFMGFVPVDDPKLAILVVIDEPEGTPYGGVVAAPIFRTIAKRSLHHLRVPPRKVAVLPSPSSEPKHPPMPKSPEGPPSKTPATSDGLMPNLVGLSMRAALNKLGAKNLEVRVRGGGLLVEQKPLPGVRLSEGSICYLRFAPPS